MIITISGKAGSGKSAVARLLADILGFRHYSMGDMRREIASKMKMDINRLNEYDEKNGSVTDKKVDNFLARLGREEDNFVADSRLGFHFIPNSVKIFLDADIETRAKRIFNDSRGTESYKSLEETVSMIEKRERSDILRYEQLYGINCYDTKNYNHVIDTSKLTPKEVIGKIREIIGSSI